MYTSHICNSCPLRVKPGPHFYPQLTYRSKLSLLILLSHTYSTGAKPKHGVRGATGPNLLMLQTIKTVAYMSETIHYAHFDIAGSRGWIELVSIHGCSWINGHSWTDGSIDGGHLWMVARRRGVAMLAIQDGPWSMVHGQVDRGELAWWASEDGP